MLSILDLKISKLEKFLGLESQQLFAFSESLTSYEQCDTLTADTTLFVGDNLPYLKRLCLTRAATVDLCYIDPPYNTGSKFLYNDRRKSTITNHFGTHSAWMGFMLPRLVAAKELLKVSGIIAISIDDYEFAYLKILMDCIFGDENFIGNVVVCRSKNGKGSKKNLASNHEYLLIYSKSDQASLRGQIDESEYNKHDQFGYYRVDGLFRKKGEASLRTDRPNMFYPLYFNPSSGEVSVHERHGWKIALPIDSKGIERRWLWSTETANQRAWQLYASKNGVIYVKNYAGDEDFKKRTKVRSMWNDTAFYTERGTNEINKIFGDKVFDTPKPLEYIKKIVDVCSTDDALILDFFAGSGTTAHAVAELNSENSSNSRRKCILMESDHDIPQNHIARNLGFDKIYNITEKRLKYIQNNYLDFSYEVIKDFSKNEISLIKNA